MCSFSNRVPRDELELVESFETESCFHELDHKGEIKATIVSTFSNNSLRKLERRSSSGSKLCSGFGKQDLKSQFYGASTGKPCSLTANSFSKDPCQRFNTKVLELLSSFERIDSGHRLQVSVESEVLGYPQSSLRT